MLGFAFAHARIAHDGAANELVPVADQDRPPRLSALESHLHLLSDTHVQDLRKHRLLRRVLVLRFAQLGRRRRGRRFRFGFGQQVRNFIIGQKLGDFFFGEFLESRFLVEELFAVLESPTPRLYREMRIREQRVEDLRSAQNAQLVDDDDFLHGRIGACGEIHDRGIRNGSIADQRFEHRGIFGCAHQQRKMVGR